MPPQTPPETKEPNVSTTPLSLAPTPTAPVSTPSAPPETPSAPVEPTPATVTPAAPAATPPVTKMNMNPEVQFSSLKPARDLWGIAWKVVFGINALPAGLFLIAIILKLFGIAEATFGSAMLASSFSIIPLLVLVDILFMGAFYMLKRPKFSEVKSMSTKLSGALGATVVLSLIFMVLASNDVQI